MCLSRLGARSFVEAVVVIDPDVKEVIAEAAREEKLGRRSGRRDADRTLCAGLIKNALVFDVRFS